MVATAGLIPCATLAWPIWLGFLPLVLLLPACVGATLIRDVVLDASTHSPVVLAWLLDRRTLRFVDGDPPPPAAERR